MACTNYWQGCPGGGTTVHLETRGGVLLALLCLLAISACQDANAPGRRGRRVLIGGVEGPALPVVSPDEGSVITRLGPLPRVKNPWGVSSDTAELFFVASDSVLELVGIDLRRLKVSTREPVTAIERRSSIGLVRVGGNAVAITPDGHILLGGGMGVDASLEGIVVLDRETHSPIAFLGPLRVIPWGLVPLPPGSAAPAGAILAVGTRDRSQPNYVFMIDPETLALRDSFTLSKGALRQALPAPDAQHVFVMTSDSIFKYDLVGHEVAARTARLGSGHLAISPDGSRLYLPDRGDGRDFLGSGLLYVYDANLQELSPVDTRAASGGRPEMQAAAVSADGHYVYISAGTGSRGPLFGPQSGQLLVVDAFAGQVLKVIPLDDWRPWEVLVF